MNKRILAMEGNLNCKEIKKEEDDYEEYIDIPFVSTEQNKTIYDFTFRYICYLRAFDWRLYQNSRLMLRVTKSTAHLIIVYEDYKGDEDELTYQIELKKEEHEYLRKILDSLV